jgi:hypothetical protein
LRAARAEGAALVAAHPYTLDDSGLAYRATAAFATDPERWTPLLDRFGALQPDTRSSLGGGSGAARLVATGDFHVPAHLATWKTMSPCAKDEEAIVAYLRSSRPAYLVRLVGAPQLLLEYAA